MNSGVFSPAAAGGVGVKLIYLGAAVRFMLGLRKKCKFCTDKLPKEVKISKM